jgi:hypothetical protein
MHSRGVASDQIYLIARDGTHELVHSHENSASLGDDIDRELVTSIAHQPQLE